MERHRKSALLCRATAPVRLFDEKRHPDAAQFTVREFARLALQFAIVRGGETHVQHFRVIAAIVDLAGERGVGKLIFSDEIALEDVRDIEAKCPRCLRQHDLAREAGSGPANATIATGRRLVRQHCHRFKRQCGQFVRTRQTVRADYRLDEPGPGKRRVRAGVADVLHLQTEDRAVFGQRDLDVARIVFRVARADQVLAPILGPFNRFAQPAAEPRHDKFLGKEMRLLAEAAADRGCHDPNDLLGQFQDVR